jgi:uncharacterized repeat protein (TIGR01451 family)
MPSTRSASILASRVRATVSVAAAVLGMGILAGEVEGQALRTIENRASATYEDANGAAGSVEAVATIYVQLAAPVSLTPDNQLRVFAGERAVVGHVITNEGEWTSQFRLSVTGPAAWSLRFYRDVNGDGRLDEGDVLIDDAIELQAGEARSLLLVGDVPAAQVGVENLPVEVRATSTIDPNTTASALDLFTVVRGNVALSLEKSVDRQEAEAGDTLTYTLTFRNGGDYPARTAVATDVLPAGLGYVPGSLVVSGAHALLSEAQLTRTENEGQQTLSLALGTVEAGAASTITFRAIIAGGAQELLRNSWSVAHETGQGTSNQVATRVVVAQLLLSKDYLGEPSVKEGSTLRYRLRWTNASPRALVGAVLVDTLPEGLEFVSAEGSHSVAGRVVSWQMEQLEPRATGTAELSARVVARPESGQLINSATLTAGSLSASAVAAAVTVEERLIGALEVRKQAGVLEAGLGDRIPYGITVANVGNAPLENIVIRDDLPRGVQLVPGSMTGADSSRVTGSAMTIWAAPALLPGQSISIGYSVLLAEIPGRGTLENVAIAMAEGLEGEVRSDNAVASVRTRSGFALESRVVVGKVWFDADGNGRQTKDEYGVGGVQILLADGQSVTTDHEGRFSFTNLRPGTHVLRLDARGLPRGMGFAAASDDIASIRNDGWTTPAVSFRLVNVRPTTPLTGRDVASIIEEQRDAQPVLVRPARTSAEREADESQSFIVGPSIRFIAPVDGSVATANRIYLGLKGEPGAAVRLYRGDSLLSATNLRPDGSADFVGVELPQGPSTFRVAMTGSWNVERWDSVTVHRSGQPARIEGPAGRVTVQTEGDSPSRVPIRVVDEWNVAIAEALVGIDAVGARVEAKDADRASVGLQLQTGIDGVVELPIRGGSEVGPAHVRVRTGSVTQVVDLRVVPREQKLMVTGIGQVGAGAAPEAFGSVSVRGSVGREASLTVSYDSRRRGAEDDFFRSGQDLLDEGRYPTLGDGSQQRASAAPRHAFSARLERGLDWVELGDVQTTDFGGSGQLSSYRRSLNGVAGQVTTGVLTWRGFGSMTDQLLTQEQIRADGSSGPYRLGSDIRAGTERVRVETRARTNAARVLSQQELAYGLDYQIDYTTGTVLLQRPLLATDGDGNPVFLVVTMERRSGAERKMVGGLGAEIDVRALARVGKLDSLTVSVGGVHDAAAGLVSDAGTNMFSGGFRARNAGLSAGAELLRSMSADSSAFAGRAEVRYEMGESSIGGSWMRVGEGFNASADPRLRGGVEELRGEVSVRVSRDTELRLSHERQSFKEREITRNRTALQAAQKVGSRSVTGEAGLVNDSQNAGVQSSAATGRVTVGITSDMDVWVETRKSLTRNPLLGQDVLQSGQEHIGGGLSYRLRPGLRLEASHREIRQDTSRIAVATLNLRSENILGGAAWTGIERAGSVGASHSAVLGWNPRVALNGAWTAHALFEQRIGLDRMPVADPSRALPFAQTERDRWSVAGGVDYMPMDSTVRVSARAERHGGAEQRGFRVDVSGDMPFGKSLAVITRHDWSITERMGFEWTESRRERSLAGLAYRPIQHDALNLLAKLEWRRDVGQLGGIQLGQQAGLARMIGTGDAVWTPSNETEMAVRYAVRQSWSMESARGGLGQPAIAHFIGGRTEQTVVGPIGMRMDARMMLAGGADRAWSVAPSLLANVGGGFLVEGGYRFGTLLDRDFGNGGKGLYGTLGFRFTERTGERIADFWRSR